jgi:hypothetical protein
MKKKTIGQAVEDVERILMAVSNTYTKISKDDLTFVKQNKNIILEYRVNAETVRKAQWIVFSLPESYSSLVQKKWNQLTGIKGKMGDFAFECGADGKLVIRKTYKNAGVLKTTDKTDVFNLIFESITKKMVENDNDVNLLPIFQMF